MTRERDRIQENANKYIIKNCKSNYKLGGKYVCGAPRIHHYFCQDCTDCVIKRIITICKGDKMSKEDMKRSKESTDIIRGSKYGRDALATQILQLFDIEEINK